VSGGFAIRENRKLSSIFLPEARRHPIDLVAAITENSGNGWRRPVERGTFRSRGDPRAKSTAFAIQQ